MGVVTVSLRRGIRPSEGLAAAVLLLGALAPPVEALARLAASSVSEPGTILEPDKPLTRAVAGGATHSYRVALATGQFLDLVVEQQGIDLAVTLIAPDGSKIGEVDGPNGNFGPEPICWIAGEPGDYRVEVAGGAPRAPEGRYRIEIRQRRAATDVDRLRFEGQKTFFEADALRVQGKAEASQNAVVLYEKAASIWHEAGDRRDLGLTQENLAALQKTLQVVGQLNDPGFEASTLTWAGFANHRLGEEVLALSLYTRASALEGRLGDKTLIAFTAGARGQVEQVLGDHEGALRSFTLSMEISRSIGDKRGEAISFNNIATTNEEIGDVDRALEGYERALALEKEIGDRNNEAITRNNIGPRTLRTGGSPREPGWRQHLGLVGCVGDDVFVHQLAMTPTGLVYAATGSGVFRRAASETSWKKASAGLNATQVQSLAADDVVGTLYAGTFLDNLHRSDDGGASWQRMLLPPPADSAYEIVLDPRDARNIFARTNAGIVRSADGGRTWLFSFPSPTGSKALWMSPADSKVLYFAAGPFADESQLYRTTDGGMNWSLLADLPFDVGTLAGDPNDARVLYAGVISISYQVGVGGRYGGCFKSLDGGATWAASNGGLNPANLPGFRRIAIDPSNRSHLYAVASYGGLFKSVDGGANWQQIGSAFGGRYVMSVAVHPRTSSIVLAGTEEGLYVSFDAGGTWSGFNEGLEGSTWITAIRFQTGSNTVRIALGGGGVREREVSLALQQPPPRPRPRVSPRLLAPR